MKKIVGMYQLLLSDMINHKIVHQILITNIFKYIIY
jgi:hypothetical protein